MTEMKRENYLSLSDKSWSSLNGMLSSKPRERILSTATSLFNEKGIQAVGVNLIIAEADVAPMTLYRQFGSKDDLVAATLKEWSERWLQWLSNRLEARGDDPSDRFQALWDALEEWFGSEDFRGSFIANAAGELRSEPGHPAHAVIAAHRTAERQLLEDLATRSGASDPAAVAAQLQVLMDGAIAIAAVDRQPGAAQNARMLASMALGSGIS
jgi:AcrR family transcriptional regulator